MARVVEARIRKGGLARRVRFFGLLRGWDVDPQAAKDELRRIHG